VCRSYLAHLGDFLPQFFWGAREPCARRTRTGLGKFWHTLVLIRYDTATTSWIGSHNMCQRGMRFMD